MFANLYERPTKRRKVSGGWRQRAAREDAASDDDLPASRPVSKLALGHLLDWADGVSSAAHVNRHMRHAVHDGLDDPLIKRIASVGSEGSTQNCHAGLMGLMADAGYTTYISTVENSSWTHVVFPSQWARLLLDSSPTEFRMRLGADTASTLEFWRGFFNAPRRRRTAATHPFLAGKTAEDLAHAIPCAVHEDAGPISKQLGIASAFRQ